MGLMISIIDRYISKIFIFYFFAGLTVFVTIFLAIDFMSTMSRFDVGTEIIFNYYKYYLPMIVAQMVPVGCLIATVFTLSTLNKSNELVALFSVGFSLARVSTPILVLVGAISIMSFWVSDKVLPEFTQKKNYIYYVQIKKKPGLYSTVKTNKIWYRSDNILFNIQSLNAPAKKAHGITLYYFDDTWKLVQLIKAQEVRMNGQTWELVKGVLTLFTEESSFPLTKVFERKSLTMSEELSDLESAQDTAEVMDVSQLRKYIKKNKEAGLNTLRYEVDYYSKMSFAFAAFVMSLIGIPFSANRQRSGGNLLNAGICMGLTFAYWVVFSSSVTMGKHGLMPPLIAAWGPNFLIGGGAFYLLNRMKK